jgi:hypothetical protein
MEAAFSFFPLAERTYFHYNLFVIMIIIIKYEKPLGEQEFRHEKAFN